MFERIWFQLRNFWNTSGPMTSLHRFPLKQSFQLLQELINKAKTALITCVVFRPSGSALESHSWSACKMMEKQRCFLFFSRKSSFCDQLYEILPNHLKHSGTNWNSELTQFQYGSSLMTVLLSKQGHPAAVCLARMGLAATANWREKEGWPGTNERKGLRFESIWCSICES